MGVRRAVARDGGAAGDRPPRHRTEARDHVQRLLAGGRPAALIPSDGRRPCSEHEADRTPRNDEGPLRQEGPFVWERMTRFELATSTLARWRSSQLSYIRLSRSSRIVCVRDTGFEPVTSSVSGKRATAAPIALVHLRRGGEHAATPGRRRLRGRDGIRTRVYGFAGRCLASRPPDQG
ncbi:conserved hypothetical protein [Micrococcus luteus]|nr:conserved hypothetical protein [Micrococcus luteus]